MIMSTYARPAYPSHGFPRNWSALDLADAVPLRLSERITLGLVEFSAPVRAANSPFAASPARKWHGHYLRSAELPTFIRVR
jgi:hypothetical protein